MSKFSVRFLSITALAAAVLIGSPASADSIKVQAQMDGAQSSKVPSNVRSECRGAWSGAKKMEVTGKLMQGREKILGSFTAYRGSYKEKACKSLYRVEQEMAKDIALWLDDPGMHDKLGAAK